MKRFWLLALTLFALRAATGEEGREKTAPRRPNVLLILTDDHYARALGSVNREVKTPALDRLAREGARMDNAYISFPVCHTARCTILTGRYPSAHRAWQNGLKLRDYEVTLGEVFLAADYRTAAIGKMHHESEGETQGIEYIWNEDDYYPIIRPMNLRSSVKWDLPTKGQFFVGVQQRPPEETLSGMITEKALKWLGEHADDEQPWFLILSYPIPHALTTPPQKYANMYDPKKVTLPPNAEHYFDSSLPWYTDTKEQLGRRRTREEIGYFLARYYGLVSQMDDYVGRVMKLLESKKALDQTIVMFAGDQGEIAGEHGWIGKAGFFYESEAKFPLIVRYPKLIPGEQVIASLVSQVDLMPTLLDLADVPIPIGVQGVSQAPVLTKEQEAVRDACFGEVHQWNKFIRSGDYALTYYRERGAELYDLAEDPHEFRNVVDDPAYAAVRKELMDRLFEWCLEKEDVATPVGFDWSGHHFERRQALRQHQKVHHPGLSVEPGPETP